MKYLLILSLILISFVTGAFVGNRVGIDSQAYYDASGKLQLISFFIDQKTEKDWVESEATTQVRILNESELTPFKSAFFLKIMGSGELVSAHEKNFPIVKASQRYKEKLNFLCKHNDRYLDKCN